MYELPTSIQIDNQEYPIRNRGDYRVILDCLMALNDRELTKEERIYASLIIFYQDLNSLEDVLELPDVLKSYQEMVRFFNCGQVEVESSQVHYNLIDWESDSNLICSAINNVAGKEIRAESYVHWWTFMGYYLAIGESPLSQIVGIRNKVARNKRLEKYERRFMNENPQYFKVNPKDAEQQEIDDILMGMWNS